MKHEEEWYSCDRCGSKIGEGYCFAGKVEKKSITVAETDSETYTTDVIRIPYGGCVINMVTSIIPRKKNIHLCKECRKDFNKFMKNWTSVYNKEPIEKE